MNVTPSTIRAIEALLTAILEAVELAGPQGVPAGTIYAGLMAHGIGLRDFEKLMAILLQAGRVRQVGQLYIHVPPAPKT